LGGAAGSAVTLKYLLKPLQVLARQPEHLCEERPDMMDIKTACFPEDHQQVVNIFREYITSPSADLGFQDCETEFTGLPGQYAAPDGCVLLAWKDEVVVGCAALRRIDEHTGEMKRVYVRPGARGEGVGCRLVVHLLETARNIGYARICLDVLPEFMAAQRLYRSLGFQPSAPVSFNPVPGTQFLALEL
jgi:putative acetyltransferase